MSFIDEELEKHNEKKLAGEKYPTYPFGLIIDNRTDFRFDDSSFAWDFKDKPGGGVAAGYNWPANSVHRINVPSGGCVKTVAGQLFVGSQRFPLGGWPAPKPDECRGTVGWIVRYTNLSFVVSLMDEKDILD